MESECCEASGSRRSCAPPVISNALNSVDFLAVIVRPEHQEEVAEGALEELQGQTGVRVLQVVNGHAPWMQGGRHFPEAAEPEAEFGRDLEALRETLRGKGPRDVAVRRAVLLWTDIDAYIREDAAHFERVLDLLCEALARPAPDVWAPFAIHRAVLIGGEGLLEHLDPLAARAPQDLQCRYLLVR